MASTLRAEVCAAIRELLTEVPPVGASARQRANYFLLKAEVFDLIGSVSDPCHVAQVRESASTARYEARKLALELGEGGW
ncbi:hypothetical protein GCM10009754_73810 [Amycolatopsis minnesotensis]|uniref:Uncharacterized protein n=1 Tax=Amycolatopsis minnesotensis TaxID=337894 RepID=A0ABN2SES7_9PSEU